MPPKSRPKKDADRSRGQHLGGDASDIFPGARELLEDTADRTLNAAHLERDHDTLDVRMSRQRSTDGTDNLPESSFAGVSEEGEQLEQSSGGDRPLAKQSAGLTTATFEPETEMTYVTLKSASRSHVSRVLSAEFVDLKFSDAVFRCSDGEVRTHKVVLATLSAILRRSLRDVADEDEAVVIAPDVTREELVKFLGKVYDGGSEKVDIAKSIAYIGFVPDPDSCINITVKQEMMDEAAQDHENARTKIQIVDKKRQVRRKVMEKYSLIWNYFVQLGDNSIAECHACYTPISTKLGKTSGMILHLKRKHPKRFKHFINSKKIQLANKQERENSEDPETSWVYDGISDRFNVSDNYASNIRMEEIIPEEIKKDAMQSSITSEIPNFQSAKRSPVWAYFRKSDQDKADCLTCHQKIDIKRGKTSGMLRHLKSAHPDCFESMSNSNSKKRIKDPLQEAVDEAIGSIQEDETQEDSKPLYQIKVIATQKPVENVVVGKRSIIWNHFRELDDGKAKCLNCEASVSKKAGSTSNMFRHMRKCQADNQHELNEQQPTTSTTLEPIIEEASDNEAEDVECTGPFKEPDAEKQEEELLLSPSVPRIFGKRSAIWAYFDPTDNMALHKCKLCSKMFSIKQQKTSNMIRHLQNQHQEEYETYTLESGQIPVRKQRKEPKQPKQPKAQTDDDFSDRTCPECLKLFSTRRTMQYHLQVVHSGLKPFTCELCGASFARRSSFISHTRSHNPSSLDNIDPSFLCSYCGKTFTSKRSRSRHELCSHVGSAQRKHQCSFCDKKFISNQQRKNHELVHTGLKTFNCGHCGKQFARDHQLKSHERIHTGDKPYHCQRCKASFRYLSSRNNHKCFSVVRPEREYISIEQLTSSKKRKRRN